MRELSGLAALSPELLSREGGGGLASADALSVMKGCYVTARGLAQRPP